MRHKAPSRWVVVNKVWLLAPQAKNRQSNHWRFPCALSELAPWRPQARHIDERQRYTKVPQTVGICFVWTVVQGRCFRHGFQFSASIDTHTKRPILIGNSVRYEYQARLIQMATITQCVLVGSGLSFELGVESAWKGLPIHIQRSADCDQNCTTPQAFIIYYFFWLREKEKREGGDTGILYTKGRA